MIWNYALGRGVGPPPAVQPPLGSRIDRSFEAGLTAICNWSLSWIFLDFCNGVLCLNVISGVWSGRPANQQPTTPAPWTGPKHTNKMILPVLPAACWLWLISNRNPVPSVVRFLAGDMRRTSTSFCINMPHSPVSIPIAMFPIGQCVPGISCS